MKTCPACKTEKTEVEFYTNAARPDGLSSYCKICQIADAKSRYRPQPPKWRAPEGFKKCSRCKDVKPKAEFSPHGSTPDKLQYYCKPCSIAATRRSQNKNRDPEEHARYNREWARANPERRYASQLKSTYGLQAGQYEHMLKTQHGRCAICKTDKPGVRTGRFHVDHCHTSSKVRALLCGACNSMLGYAHDSPDILREAAEYLEKNK